MRLRKQIEVERPPEEVFAYVADFSNAERWDPGVAASSKRTEGPVRVGTEFHLDALFRNKTTPFDYVVTELEEDRCIVLVGEGAKARSTDTVTVARIDGRTRITYEADLRLKGIYRLAEPFLKRTMSSMGDDALAGLQRVLSDR